MEMTLDEITIFLRSLIKSVNRDTEELQSLLDQIDTVKAANELTLKLALCLPESSDKDEI
jgi:hypothetical protein